MNPCDTTPSATRESEPEPIGDVLARSTRLRGLTPLTPEQAAANESYNREVAQRAADRERAERLRSLTDRLGERYSPKRCSLDSFRAFDPKQKAAVQSCRGIVSRIREFVESGDGLLFFGPVGTGKDHLLAAMLYAAVDAGFRCSWVNGQEVFGAFRDRIDSHEGDEFAIRNLVAPQVLGISDPVPPGKDASGWDLNNLYRIIDRRYRAMKPTWLTLNALSESEADEKLTAAVFDRVQHNATIVPCFWPSYRVTRNGV